MKVYSIAQRRQSLSHGTTNFARIGPAVPEIYWQTDRQTDRNTPHPYRGRVTKMEFKYKGDVCIYKVTTAQLFMAFCV